MALARRFRLRRRLRSERPLLLPSDAAEDVEAVSGGEGGGGGGGGGVTFSSSSSDMLKKKNYNCWSEFESGFGYAECNAVYHL
jgi:hypothetical protein